VSIADPVAELRTRLAAHGYSVFLRPDRPSGWWVVLHGGRDRLTAPAQTRAATRAEALQIAEGLFVTHRLKELDDAIREAGQQPPRWDAQSQHEHLEALRLFAEEHGIAA